MLFFSQNKALDFVLSSICLKSFAPVVNPQNDATTIVNIPSIMSRIKLLPPINVVVIEFTTKVFYIQ